MPDSVETLGTVYATQIIDVQNYPSVSWRKRLLVYVNCTPWSWCCIRRCWLSLQ